MKEYKFKINGREYKVTVNSVENSVADVQVNGVNYRVGIEKDAPGAVSAPTPAAPVRTAKAAPVHASNPEAPSAVSGKTVVSPLPGVIINVCVGEGQSVKRGERVAVLEAMKMENDLLAPANGKVKKVMVSKGDSVLEGAQIVVIE